MQGLLALASVVSAGLDAQARHGDPGEWPLGFRKIQVAWLAHLSSVSAKGGILTEPFGATAPSANRAETPVRDSEPFLGVPLPPSSCFSEGQGALPLGLSQVSPSTLAKPWGTSRVGSPGLQRASPSGSVGREEGRGRSLLPAVWLFSCSSQTLAFPLILLSPEADKENTESPQPCSEWSSSLRHLQLRNSPGSGYATVRGKC